MTNVSNKFFSKLRNKERQEGILFEATAVKKVVQFSDDVSEYFYMPSEKEFKMFEESGRAVLVTSEFEIARLKKYCRENSIAI